MPEMIVSTPEKKHTVNDYDFIFSSGMMMPITVDLSAGDSIEWNDTVIRVTITAKPSVNDEKKLLPATDLTIFTKHLLSVQHWVREITELTPEEKFQWKKTLAEVAGTVQ